MARCARAPRTPVLALTAGALAVAMAGCGAEAAPPMDRSLEAQASSRVRPLVQARHAKSLQPGQLEQCVVRTFGVEPADAATIADVRVVYAGTWCVTVQQGVAFDQSGSSQEAVAVHLDSGVVESPRDGQVAKDVHRLFPERLWDRAMHPITAEDAPRAGVELRRRFAGAESGLPADAARD
jgi:hypothetical protein